MEITNEILLRGRQNNQCWFAPGLSVAHGHGCSGMPLIHIGVSQLTGNDTGPQHWIHTSDFGRRWSPPMESQNLLGIPRENHFFEKPAVRLFYHHKTDRLLALGSTSFLRDAGTHSGFKMESHDWKKECMRKNTMVFSEWDFKTNDFANWKPVPFPGELKRFHRNASPSIHLELDDGTLLASSYVIDSPGDSCYGVLAMRIEIGDTGEFRVVETGDILRKDTKRGLCEPSVIKFHDRYFMTIRHDDTAYVAVSSDGLRYNDPVEWRFDDESPLGNYNTQQKWLVHDDALFLIYNRRHKLNNGVFRSRAPLFMSEIDPHALRVIRATEQVVFPEKGARMGNFDALNVSDKEAWVVTGEWLEQLVPDHMEGMRFHVNAAPKYNRIQYIGDLLLARIRF